MHGVIFLKLKDFAIARLGEDSWTNAVGEAGASTHFYLPTQIYPDMEAVALIEGISRLMGVSSNEMLQEFGEFIVPDLLTMYGSLLNPSWKTLDVIEYTEETIHRVVRMKNPGADPPEISCQRKSLREVNIRYSSARKMCGMAKGIAQGLAKHFGESIVIDETVCMLRGSPKCEISVTLEN